MIFGIGGNKGYNPLQLQAEEEAPHVFILGND